MKVIKNVNFPSYVFSSFVAGYVMMAVDMMMDGFLGLFGTYREYLQMVRQFGIFQGFEGIALVVGHTINSLVLALFFVDIRVYDRIPLRGGLAKGIFFGAVWHMWVLVFILSASIGGSKFATSMLHAPYTSHISLFLLHLIWGGTLGLLYTPKEL